jgi:uncharacterized membrane protein YbhN (UPF0104 family)
MFLNWGIEAVKWRFLIRKLEKLSFIKAFTAVLSGVTISTFLPNRTGEYLGRVFILDKANRIHGILITIIGSISQLLVTVIFGLLSLMFILKDYLNSLSIKLGLSSDYLLFGLILLNLSVIAICIFIYFNLASLIGFTNRIKALRKYKLTRYLKIFAWFSNKELLRILFLSLFRYIIFSLQFYLILSFLGLSLPVFRAGIFISSVFFITTIIPSIAFSELGLRGSVAISLFGFYFADLYHVSNGILVTDNWKLVTATSALWLINLIIPAIIGSLFIFRLRFFKKN